MIQLLFGAALARLWRLARRVLERFPGTSIAADQAYREIDVAIDFCEDVPALPLSVATAVKAAFEAEGAVAKISSIHVNAWYGAHDKLSMARRFLARDFGIDCDATPMAVAYAGDSPNDAPMFQAFPLSYGVANILPLLPLVEHLSGYVTQAAGGAGFAEIAEAILAARRGIGLGIRRDIFGALWCCPERFPLSWNRVFPFSGSLLERMGEGARRRSVYR